MIKRRPLLIRTVTGALSATVFMATGWLMGTRTLSMPCVCGPGQACNFWCDGQTFCVQCIDQPYCKYHWVDYYGCNGGGCACYCRVIDSYGLCYYVGCGPCW